MPRPSGKPKHPNSHSTHHAFQSNTLHLPDLEKELHRRPKKNPSPGESEIDTRNSDQILTDLESGIQWSALPAEFNKNEFYQILPNTITEKIKKYSRLAEEDWLDSLCETDDDMQKLGLFAALRFIKRFSEGYRPPKVEPFRDSVGDAVFAALMSVSSGRDASRISNKSTDAYEDFVRLIIAERQNQPPQP